MSSNFCVRKHKRRISRRKLVDERKKDPEVGDARPCSDIMHTPRREAFGVQPAWLVCHLHEECS